MEEDLAKLIKDKRIQLGITQDQLAKCLSCEASLISMWETRKRRVPPSRYDELSKALQIPLEQIKEIAKENNIMNNEFNKMFYELATPSDAMRFIEYTLMSFDVDSRMKVTLKALLRNYLLLELIITMLEKETYQEQEGNDFEWDYTWFQANVEFNALNQIFEKKHRDLYGKIVNEDADSKLSLAGGRTFEVLSTFLNPNETDPESIRLFRIHLLEYCHYLDDLATGTNETKTKFYCARFVED